MASVEVGDGIGLLVPAVPADEEAGEDGVVGGGGAESVQKSQVGALRGKLVQSLGITSRSRSQVSRMVTDLDTQDRRGMAYRNGSVSRTPESETQFCVSCVARGGTGPTGVDGVQSGTRTTPWTMADRYSA